MKLDAKVKKQIEETKYLSTENTWRYRSILRKMYTSYEKMKNWLYKEDIFELLKVYEEFDEYTMERLKLDLDNLVTWKNLIAIADVSKVRTIEEFKNKEFRYQLAPYTIEIERMLISLESIDGDHKASLEYTLVEHFRENLGELTFMLTQENRLVYDWWNRLNQQFKDLNENYQDYINQFYTPKYEEMLKTTEFLVFKESFIRYLREFIKGLQINGMLIQQELKSIETVKLEHILEKVWAYQKTIPNLDKPWDYDNFMELHLGRYESICEWFLPYKGKEPLMEQLVYHTNEIIRKITRFAAQIADRRSQCVNRKEEYRHITKLFASCEEIEEAHLLSACVFGAFHTKHIMAQESRCTESMNSSIYEEPPTEVLLKPRVRTYREKMIKNPIVDKSKQKTEKLAQVLEARKKDEELVQRFIVDGVLDFRKLPVLTTKERGILLRWISKAKENKGGKSKTEYGKSYSLEYGEGYIKLTSEDGVFTMPYFILHFQR